MSKFEEENINDPLVELYQKNSPLFTRARMLMQDSLAKVAITSGLTGMGVTGVSALMANWDNFNQLQGAIEMCEIRNHAASGLADVASAALNSSCVPLDVQFGAVGLGLMVYPLVQYAMVNLGRVVEKAIENVSPEFKNKKVSGLADLYEKTEKLNKEIANSFLKPDGHAAASPTGRESVLNVMSKYENMDLYPNVMSELNRRKGITPK